MAVTSWCLHVLCCAKSFSQTSFKKKEMDTIRNERSRVINISWNNLFRNRP